MAKIEVKNLKEHNKEYFVCLKMAPNSIFILIHKNMRYNFNALSFVKETGNNVCLALGEEGGLCNLTDGQIEPFYGEIKITI